MWGLFTRKRRVHASSRHTYWLTHVSHKSQWHLWLTWPPLIITSNTTNAIPHFLSILFPWNVENVIQFRNVQTDEFNTEFLAQFITTLLLHRLAITVYRFVNQCMTKKMSIIIMLLLLSKSTKTLPKSFHNKLIYSMKQGTSSPFEGNITKEKPYIENYLLGYNTM
jgi:hypothetical protein